MKHQYKLIFATVVLLSGATIYGVHYQRQQERIFMRRLILKELEERREKKKLAKESSP